MRCLVARSVSQAVYETFDLDNAVEKLVQTTLRSIIGDMGLDDTLASREEIERGLELRIKSICFDWGLEIKSCELLELTPTPSVQDAMHQQLRAERERYARRLLFLSLCLAPPLSSPIFFPFLLPPSFVLLFLAGQARGHRVRRRVSAEGEDRVGG